MEIIVLRILHIGLGVIWAGWALSLAFFVEPAVRSLGPQGGAFMQALATKTRLMTVMMYAPIVVIITGVRLLGIVSGNFNAEWLTSVHGMVLTAGSVLGILVYGHGMFTIRPNVKKLGALSRQLSESGEQPAEELLARIAQLREKIRRSGVVLAVMMLVTVVIMAVARYTY